jgi:hypothetical protein
MTSDWVTPKMKDEALDFARDNSHIKFCDVMYKLFWIKGDLSDKQYLKLLEIKAAFLRSRNRRR